LHAYADAGADVLFPEALSSQEEMQIVCRALENPVVANMAHGGLTPILPAKTLQAIGFAFAIFPALTSLVAALAIEQALTTLRATGDTADCRMFDFKEFCALIGFEDVWAFERRWAR
jgi:2-methylisocitrate lyase-like PEP mutase family enzyme